MKFTKSNQCFLSFLRNHLKTKHINIINNQSQTCCAAHLLIQPKDNQLIDVLFQIATSPLSYGFYHTYPPYEHYDKRSRDNWHNIAEARQDLGSNRIIKDIINVKNERLNIEDAVNNENVSKNTIKRAPKESVLYPVRSSAIDLSSQHNLASTNTPFNQQLIDITSRPGEVQADYSLDLPYNGFHFQSPTSVISA